MNRINEKGMWKRTFCLFTAIQIPWILYVLKAVAEIISTKVALLYIPYESRMKTGDIQDLTVVWFYIGLLSLNVLAGSLYHIPGFYASNTVSRSLRTKLIDRSLHLPIAALEKYGSKIISWINRDSDSADGLINTLVGFITGLAAIYMTMGSLSDLDTSFLYVVPIILVYILFATWLEGRLVFLRQRLGKAAQAGLTAYLSEHLSFVSQVKQLHSADEELARGKAAIQDFYKADIRQSVYTLLNNFVSGPVTSFITILVFLFGIPKVNNGTLSLVQLAAFQSYILVAYQSLSSMPGLYTSLMYYIGELYYISTLMNEKEEIYQRKRTMDIPDSDLVFDHVSFAYDETPVIKDVSFTIAKGQVTMLAGPNGCGKSTLFKLIERFYTPDSGEIRFGKIPAEEIHLDEWRQSMTYVLQDPQLFNGTIRDNINYGLQREVLPEETESAARMACAEEFILEFPEGYDFEIGENGCRLSAGQRQRIAIARALMMDPAYLLLDEATCNMDIYSEDAVTKALLELMKGRTTIMISHDMRMLDHADHVIVINNGSVEAEGTAAEALNASETLRALTEVSA